MTALQQKIKAARARLLKMHFEARVGHIGGNLSAIDLMMALHHEVMTPDDSFILSKGHAAGALYITLWSCGRIADDELASFHKDNTRLSGHPAPKSFEDIPFATGSLGHGLSLAAGIALGRRLQSIPGRVYCLLSDGEWQEGSTWEAAMFIAHNRLPVTLVVDTNGLQGFGSTEEIASQGPLTDRLRAFGFETREIEGHDLAAIRCAFDPECAGPAAVVALTRKGAGVSFMENKMEWHYLPMSQEQYDLALAENSAA